MSKAIQAERMAGEMAVTADVHGFCVRNLWGVYFQACSTRNKSIVWYIDGKRVSKAEAIKRMEKELV